MSYEHLIIEERGAALWVTMNRPERLNALNLGMFTGFRALSALSRGETPGPENSIGKLVAGPTMQEIAIFAEDLQAQAGIITDPDLAAANGRFQAMLMRSPATRVEGGTDEILRNIIAERVLGLPADIRVDKDVPFNQIPTSGRG